jgi:hypothetical protein
MLHYKKSKRFITWWKNKKNTSNRVKIGMDYGPTGENEQPTWQLVIDETS